MLSTRAFNKTKEIKERSSKRLDSFYLNQSNEDLSGSQTPASRVLKQNVNSPLLSPVLRKPTFTNLRVSFLEKSLKSSYKSDSSPPRRESIHEETQHSSRKK